MNNAHTYRQGDSLLRSTAPSEVVHGVVRGHVVTAVGLLRERMAGLLTSSDLTVAEAARAVGWTDQSYASRCFHAHYGASPTEYRRRHPAPPPG